MNELIKEMGPSLYSAGAPAKPAVPGTPAYCTQVVAGYTYTYDDPEPLSPYITNQTQITRDSLGNAVYAAYDNFTSGGVYDIASGGTSGGAAKPVYKTVCFRGTAGIPAQPARPASVEQTYNLGWNAGARSVEAVSGDAYAMFKVPLNLVGAMVGLTNTAPDAAGLPTISYGVEVSRGEAYIVENSRRVAVLGPYAAGDTFHIARSGGSMHYRIGPSYDAPTASVDRARAPEGAVWLGALLYAGRDSIYDPALSSARVHAAQGSGAGSMAPLLGVGGTAWGFGVAALLPVEGGGQAVNTGRGSAVLKRLEGLGGAGRFTAGAGVIHNLTGYGTAGMSAPRFGLGVGYLAPLVSTGRLLVGTLGAGGGEMPRMEGVGADRPYGAGGGKLAALRGQGQAKEGPARASVWAMAGMFDGVAAAARWFVVMRESVRAQGQLEVGLVSIAQLITELSQTTPWYTAGELRTVLQEVARQLGVQTGALYDITGAEPQPFDTSEAWAVNQEGGASTAYKNFGFTSFARVGNDVLAVRPDGVYKLGGDTDAGRPVDAAVAFGTLDLEVTPFKQVSNVYAGTSTQGSLFLKVTTPQGSWVYKARRHDPALQQQRFDLGRGLRANYYEFELYNSEGCDFELDTVEFLTAINARKI